MDGLTLAYRKVPFDAFAADLWVKEGAATTSKRGIAHFLEHMVFKGARGRSWSDILTEIDSTGGIINAATSYDFTHYYSLVPFPEQINGYSPEPDLRNWQVALKDVLDMVFYPEFSPLEVEREKKVVLEEYVRSVSSPAGFLFRKGFEYLFGDSPYGCPILGYPEDIKAFSVEDLRSYHRRYQLSDMLLAVAGNVDLKEVRTFVSEYIRALERNAPGYFQEDSSIEKGASGGVRFKPLKNTVEKSFSRFDNTYFLLMFQGPPARSKDQIPMDVLSYMLLGGGSSVFYRILKEEKEMVYFVEGGFGTLRDSGYFYVFGQTEPEKVQKVKEEILKILKNPSFLTIKDFRRAKSLLLSNELREMQSLTGLTGKIGFYWAMDVPEIGENYVEEVESVSFEEVKSLPSRYFDGKSYVFLWTGKPALEGSFEEE